MTLVAYIYYCVAVLLDHYRHVCFDWVDKLTNGK